MRVEVKGETELLVTAAGTELEIRETEAGHFDSLAMLAASLGGCTLSVLAGWGQRAGLDLAGLSIRVGWTYVEDPYRVGSYDLEIRWPGLPPERETVARRVAAACTVKSTLAHPPDIRVALAAEEG